MDMFVVFWECVKDWLQELGYFLRNNLRGFAMILEFLSPYILYALVVYLYSVRGKLVVGSEVFVPPVLFLLTNLLRSAANKVGKGYTLPKPRKRFTVVEDDGEVTVERKRLEEMMLYVADLEDWMERKGLL